MKKNKWKVSLCGILAHLNGSLPLKINILINVNKIINIRALCRIPWHVTSWKFAGIYHFVCYRKSLHPATPKWVVLQCAHFAKILETYKIINKPYVLKHFSLTFSWICLTNGSFFSVLMCLTDPFVFILKGKFKKK